MSDNTHSRDYYRMLSPVTLAFMGDAVYEILTREHLIKNGNIQANTLHKKSVQIVRAAAQAQAVSRIIPSLTQEEHDVLRRGRNANTAHVPKNSKVLDYRHATGLEALFGFLYLCGEDERILELFTLITSEEKNEITMEQAGI